MTAGTSAEEKDQPELVLKDDKRLILFEERQSWTALDFRSKERGKCEVRVESMTRVSECIEDAGARVCERGKGQPETLRGKRRVVLK